MSEAKRCGVAKITSKHTRKVGEIEMLGGQRKGKTTSKNSIRRQSRKLRTFKDMSRCQAFRDLGVGEMALLDELVQGWALRPFE